MATASKVQLSADVGDWPEYYRIGITEEQAKKASEVLQENHEQHHIFFSPAGFHNHIVHHVLAVWALNASPEAIQKGYETNKTSQRQQAPVDKSMVEQLQDTEKFMSYLGPEDHYPTFLQFFKDQMEKTSWENVLQKYVFAGDERADAMLVLMYAGFLHPIIVSILMGKSLPRIWCNLSEIEDRLGRSIRFRDIC